jgi:putative oxidoreductase
VVGDVGTGPVQVGGLKAMLRSSARARDGGTGRDWLALERLVFGVGSTSLPKDLALLAVRAVLTWIFIYYGAGKLFGAFDGGGIHRTAQYFSQAAGLNPGTLWAWVGGLTEFLGGIAMALGLATRLAGLALVGDMVIAMITVTWATGLNANPGYQVNIAVAALALVTVFLGSGRFSVDHLIDQALIKRNAKG